MIGILVTPSDDFVGILIIALFLTVTAVVGGVLLIGFDRIANRGPKHPKQLAVLWGTGFLLWLPVWVFLQELDNRSAGWRGEAELICLWLLALIPLPLLWVTGKWFVRK